MPALEQTDRRQSAVLWTKTGVGRDGQPTYASPVELDPSLRTGVRWVWSRKDAVDADTETLTADATAVVDRYIVPGSLMWLGKLLDWYGVGSSGNDTGLMVVLDYKTTIDVRNRHTRRCVTLARCRSKP